MMEDGEKKSGAENDHGNIDPGGWLLTHPWCLLESKIMPEATFVHV